jgi:RNA polymerase sigma factor (sigma-70 family)
MSVVAQNDAELVGGSLAGNRDAFGQIVARYQSLVCSLAYSATGSLSQSEDLAQETFVAAWKQLAGLRDPEKLRAWLCGIARNLINNSLRRQGHEPSHQAESLEEISESHSLELQPGEQTISNEEAAILWRSLERIPEIYREPLVLFYREHQSIEAVAQELELSEDAVKQRLSRGRKMLQEQVLAFVEGALERTSPGKAFTLGVVAALPVLTTTAKAAAVGATAAKGGAMAKAAGLSAFFQFFLKAILPVASIISLGGYFGYKMGGDAGQSPRQRESVATFWRIVVACLVVFVALPILAILVAVVIPVPVSKETLCAAITIWLGVMYAVIPAALILWAWQRRRGFHRREIAVEETVEAKRRPFKLWVALGVIGMACVLGLVLSDTNWKVQYLNTAQVRKLIADGKNKDIQFSIMQYQNGQRYFFIKVLENGKLSKFDATVDDGTLALLKENGMACPAYVQGRDFEIFGWPGRLLAPFCVFILAMGTVIFFIRPSKNQTKTKFMTKGNKITIVVAVLLTALIVTSAFWHNYRKTHSSQQTGGRVQAPLTLTPQLANEAEQTARDFFEALGKADWNKTDKLCSPGFPLSAQLDDQTKNMMNGLTLVSLGEPFTKPPYPGVFVPYEIRFKSGESKKFNLAVRQDNPERKWYWDGGF